MTRVGDRPRPLQLPGSTKLGKQNRMQPLPDPGPLPLIHPAVTRRTSTEPELRRQMPPRDPGMQHKQDPLQRQPVRHPLPARITKAPLDPRQQRLDPNPQLVRHDPWSSSHRHPLNVDDGCRRHSPPTNGSLHFGTCSKPRTANANVIETPAPIVRAASNDPAVAAGTSATQQIPATGAEPGVS